MSDVIPTYIYTCGWLFVFIVLLLFVGGGGGDGQICSLCACNGFCLWPATGEAESHKPLAAGGHGHNSALQQLVNNNFPNYL